MATRSVFFAFIGAMQLVPFALLVFSHVPNMVEFGWINFATTDPEMAIQMRDDGHKMIYGVWQYCTDDDSFDKCHFIEDGDPVVSTDTLMRELNAARVCLCVANFMSLLVLLTSIINAIQRREGVVSIHLYFALAQLLCAGAAASLASHVLRLEEWHSLTVNWVLYVLWVAVGVSLLVLLFSFLAPCVRITYESYEDQPDSQFFTPDEHPHSKGNEYSMSHNF